MWVSVVLRDRWSHINLRDPISRNHKIPQRFLGAHLKDAQDFFRDILQISLQDICKSHGKDEMEERHPCQGLDDEVGSRVAGFTLGRQG